MQTLFSVFLGVFLAVIAKPIGFDFPSVEYWVFVVTGCVVGNLLYAGASS